MFHLLEVLFKGVELCLIDRCQLAPRLHLATIATHGDATLSGLHAVGIEIPQVGHAAEFIPDAEALLQQRHSRLQIGDVLRPFVHQHQLGSTHLQLEGLGKGGIAQEIIPYALELIGMASRLRADGGHLD